MRGGIGVKTGLVALIAAVASGGVCPPGTGSPVAAAVAVRDVALTATEALIMTGTNMHTVDSGWMQMAVDQFIRPTLGGQYVGVPVETPEEFWPFGGITDAFIDDSILRGGSMLDAAIADAVVRSAQSGDPDAPIVVFGYSQSAVIVTRLKRRLSESVSAGEPAPALSFVVIGNPARPNGGIYSRFVGQALPGWTMSGPTPTDTGFRTVDIARQYDFFADFPEDPSNTLAVANAVMGAVYAHDYRFVSVDPADPRYNPGTVVQSFGDTTYYFIPAEHLPLLQPLWDLGVSPEQLVEIEPVLRDLIEAGYDRDVPFGEPTPARPAPVPAPVPAAGPAPAAAAIQAAPPVQRAAAGQVRSSDRAAARTVPARGDTGRPGAGRAAAQNVSPPADADRRSSPSRSRAAG